MAKNSVNQEERQIIKLLEKLHLPEEEKNGWLERIRGGEMSEELAEEIRGKLGAHAEGDDEQVQANRARTLVEFTNLVRHWRLSRQSQNFARK